MKKRLFVLLLCVACIFVLSGCENFGTVNNNTNYATVEEGMAALNECKNYRMSAVLELVDYDNDSSNEEIILKVEQTLDITKIQFSMSGFTYKFYLQTQADDGKNYLFFEPSALGAEYPGYVKGEVNEVINAFLGVEPDNPNNPDLPSEEPEEITLIKESFAHLINFFTNMKNDYFDFKSNKYKLNEIGKEEFLKALNAFQSAINGGEVIEGMDFDPTIEVKTNETIITKITLELAPLYEEAIENQRMIVTFDFDLFDKVELTVPEDTISFKEFMDYLENEQPSIEYYE